MTLVITRASCRYALMVTDRRVTKNGAIFDPFANKNIVFEAKNAVVAIGYTGMAYVRSIPTDQWIAQTITGLTFPEGRGGQGTVPHLMTTKYERDYLGVTICNLRDQLNKVPSLIPETSRHEWTVNPFDLLIAGFEWNYRKTRWKIRPYLRALSKPCGTDEFELSEFRRYWYVPQGGRFPVHMFSVPRNNLTGDELGGIQARLCSPLGLGDGTWHQIADEAEKLCIETIKDVSARRRLVGPDAMSILIPHPSLDSFPVIRVRYVSAGRDQGLLIASGTKKAVPVAFSPWVISSGCIQSPSIFTNLQMELELGPYRVSLEGPRNEGMPGAASSQVRPPS